LEENDTARARMFVWQSIPLVRFETIINLLRLCDLFHVWSKYSSTFSKLAFINVHPNAKKKLITSTFSAFCISYLTW
jgi:hypothetical protein